jgi:hypothetical protein
MTPEYADDLLGYLARTSPKSVLTIGAEARSVAETYCTDHARCRTVAAAATADCPQGCYDLALISTTLESLDKQAAYALVARMRDRCSRRLIVIAPIGVHRPSQASVWSRQDFLAMGMRLLGSYRRNGKPLHIYEFAIEEYKPAPEWLNSKHWANPELFDKFWW